MKNKKRVRDFGEVFTPENIVNDMLDLVNQETQRIESRFLEPACGNGNFLIQVLKRKILVIEKKYKKSQFDYELNLILAVSSIYGIDLLEDNILEAQKRLYDYCYKEYKRLFKKKVNDKILECIKFILSKNLIQGNALSLKNDSGDFLIFSERSLINYTYIKRRDFVFEQLIDPKIVKNDDLFDTKNNNQFLSDTNQEVFLPIPIKEYNMVNFLEIGKTDDQF